MFLIPNDPAMVGGIILFQPTNACRAFIILVNTPLKDSNPCHSTSETASNALHGIPK
jgi:hypothetical protein